MGDRGNIVVRSEDDTNRGDVWLYTHWGGCDLPKIVEDAINKVKRQSGMLNDSGYFTRIVFVELMSKGSGAFIQTSIGDNEHPILVIDLPAKLVYTVRESSLDEFGRLPDKPELTSEAFKIEEFNAGLLPGF